MTNPMGNRHHIETITVRKADKILVVGFEDHSRFELPAELLRVESPSAEVQGHSPGEKKLVSGRSHVGIISVEPVGNYAVKIVFDDLHDSGIFTWDYLHWLGENRETIWADYLAAIDAAGLSRHPNATSPDPVPSGGCGCGGGGKSGCG